VARDWCNSGSVVFCRTLTRASEGRGIVVAETVDQLVDAPVYTKYLKKKREFRVHIFKDHVVQVVEKRKRSGWDSPRDTRIRNTANGYVFCRDVTDPPAGLRELALRASLVTQSDFKGVDIGYNEKLDQLFVIEVNSAPGIEGSNVTDYINTILNYGK
jgi:glutathione synthase/RimK-type ligase-like ATP-grasp enzyme